MTPNRTARRSAGFALAAALAFAPAAFAEDTAPEGAEAAQAEAKAAASAEAPAPKATDVVATVGGREVTLGELIVLRGDLPEQYQAYPPAQLIEALLQRVMVESEFAARAEAAGLDKTAEMEIRAKLDRRSRLAEAHMRTVIEGAASDEAVAAAYKEQVTDAPAVEEVRASHILVKEEEMAKDLLKQIEDGAEFAALAKEHGTDGTKDRGGDLGWFAKEMMVPEFADAAFEAEEGAVVGPVQTQFGYHLIHVTGKREQPKPTLEEMRGQIAEQLANDAAKAEIAGARAELTVEMAEDAPAAEAVLDDGLLRE
ncbi:peptidylprolyl isomerase [Rhodovulum sp. DZ06]|uniref:peptidylprolyl isomerase n=1 Tax=Rhodovulum sp. DZ06 TaxID=3425126 RepID=UPI003D333EA0